MKKILLLLFITLISCEKGDLSNELAGTSWLISSGPDMVRIDKVYPDGRPYFITFQQTQIEEVYFIDSKNGIRRSRRIGGGEEYESDYSQEFTYTFNAREKTGEATFQLGSDRLIRPFYLFERDGEWIHFTEMDLKKQN